MSATRIATRITTNNTSDRLTVKALVAKRPQGQSAFQCLDYINRHVKLAIFQIWLYRTQITKIWIGKFFFVFPTLIMLKCEVYLMGDGLVVAFIMRSIVWFLMLVHTGITECEVAFFILQLMMHQYRSDNV